MFDGKLVELDTPVICLEDRGYQYGDGVYDAWAIINGKPFLQEEHLDRLDRSCNFLGIKPCFSRTEVEEICKEMIKQSDVINGAIYLQWTRGLQSPRSHVYKTNVRPLLSGSILLGSMLEDVILQNGKAIFMTDERHLFCHIKTLNLLGNIMARSKAAEAECQEAIFVRDYCGRKIVTERSHSNCFAVKNGVIYTAPLENLILPGITRNLVIKLAVELGLKVVEEYQTPELFQSADEVFITNAFYIMPIVAIENRPVGGGDIGPVYDVIRKAYQKAIFDNL